MKYAILGLFLLFSFQNCSQVAPGENEDQSLSSVSEEQFKADVLGAWMTPCQPFPSMAAYYKIRIEFVKVGTDMRIGTTSYWSQDAGCANTYLTESQVRNVTSLTESAGGFQVVADLVSQSVTVLTNDAAATSNAQSMCGMTGWVAGQTRSTFSSTCRRPASTADMIRVSGGQLFRSLDEARAPTVATGVSVGAVPYSR